MLKNICALPFYVADCFKRNKNTIIEHVEKSDSPDLSKDTGRIFDVVLFMQGSQNLKIINYTRGDKWYNIQSAINHYFKRS